MEKRTIRPVRLGGVVLGEGRPKVCVPVMGESIAAFGRSAAQAARAGAEVIELRIDSLNAMPSAQEAIAACRAVREAAGDVPILFTLRTARDGGPGSADAAAYAALLAEVAQAGVCEAIDVELSVGNAAFARLVRAAHAGGAAVVGSSHEFGEIADIRLAGEWLRRQRALGADVCKAAIMPRDDEQALELALDMLRASKALDAPASASSWAGPACLRAYARRCWAAASPSARREGPLPPDRWTPRRSRESFRRWMHRCASDWRMTGKIFI